MNYRKNGVQPRDWKPEASRALFDEYASNSYDALTTKANRPPVVLTSSGPIVADYFDVITSHPRAQVLWSWPGQWRTDVFIGRAKDIISDAKQRGLVQ